MKDLFEELEEFDEILSDALELISETLEEIESLN